MMFYRLLDKRKTLTQIDPVYSNVTAYMSAQDRINYCRSLISETENFLDSSSRLLDGKVKEKYEEIISAAKSEIKNLVEQE